MSNKNIVVWLASICVLMAGSAQGQLLESSAGVSGGTQSPLCGQSRPTSASCSATWNYSSLGIDAGGSGSALGIAEYGSLHGSVQATSYVHQTFDGYAWTDAGAGGDFYDYLTFPRLTSGAFVKVTIAVSGKFSGDLTWVDTPVDTVARVTSSTDENKTGYCELMSIQGVCSASIAVSPGNVVVLFGRLGLHAYLTPSGSTIGTDSMSLDYLKPYGATVHVALVDASGNVIKGQQGEVVAASKTNYNVSPTTTTLASGPNPSIYGQKVIFTATVTTSGSLPPTGTVAFTWGDAYQRYTIGTATLNSSGVATLVKSNLNADPYPLTAVYQGDANNLGSASSVLNQKVLPTTSAATITSSLNPSSSGEAVTFTAKITSPAVMATGPVTFTAGTTVLGMAQLSGGKATFTTSALAVGSAMVTATYYGDSNIAKSSASVIQTVQP